MGSLTTECNPLERDSSDKERRTLGRGNPGSNQLAADRCESYAASFPDSLQLTKLYLIDK